MSLAERIEEMETELARLKHELPSPAVERAVKQVAFIVDKSGSMQSCRTQVISGFNEFVGDLKKEAALDIRFTLTLFDTVVEERHTALPVADVPLLGDETYVPGGCTALYDALGLTLASLENRLGEDRETPVVVVVMTDGLENSSREYGQRAISDRIKALSDKGNWTFVFMGADQDAWAAAAPLGIPPANTLSYASAQTGATMEQTTGATLKHLKSGARATRDFYGPPTPGDTARARSEGAKLGWDIRRAKEAAKKAGK